MGGFASSSIRDLVVVPCHGRRLAGYLECAPVQFLRFIQDLKTRRALGVVHGGS